MPDSPQPAALDEGLRQLEGLTADELLARGQLGDLVRAAGCDGLADFLALAFEVSPCSRSS